MADKTAVLITGAAQRVGAYLAQVFADEGYDILLHFHKSEAAAESPVCRIPAYNH